MANRKVILFLLPLVLIIWGVIIYRIINAIADHELPVAEEIHRTAPPKKGQVQFTLALNYPDPFLGTPKPRSKPASKETKVTQTKPKKVLEKKVTSPSQPVLRYNGRVENRSSNQERHLISLNGNPHIVTIGQEVDGVVLKKVYQDSVQFKWNKETIFVRR